MEFINPKGDEKLCKKYKTYRALFTALPLLIFLIAGIILAVFVVKDGNTDIIFKVGLGAGIVLGCEIPAAIAAFIIHVYAFSNKITKTASSVTVDFNSNLAICERCGKYIKFSEYSWNVSSGDIKSKSGEYSHSTTRQGIIHIKGVCPACKAGKGVTVQVDLETTTYTTKHDIINDKDVTTTHTEKLSSEQIAAKVKEIYDEDNTEARRIVNENKRNGYVMKTK